MNQRPECARRHLARGFVDRYDTPGVQRGVAVGIVAGQNFELGMHHQQVAGVVVELDLSVQRGPHSGQKTIHQISTVEPFREQPLFRCVLENRFKEPDVPAAKSAQMRGLHVSDDGRHFSGRKLRDGLDVGAIFVAERRVGQQIFHRNQAFGLEHLGARGPNAFHVFERSGSV